MLNITDEQKALFDNDIGNKEIRLELSKGNKKYVIFNDNIISESMELNEGLSTEKTIRYGQCFSSKFSIDIFNIRDKFGSDKKFIGYNIKVYISIKNPREYIYPNNIIYPSNTDIYPNWTSEGVELPLFVGVIQDSILDDNRNTRKLIAYDVLYFKLNTDVSDLYWNDFLENGRSAKYIRETILSHLGIEYEHVELSNDDVAFENVTFEERKNVIITARKALESILEICGCFGHINRYGIFTFKELSKTYFNYPSLQTNPLVKYPTGTLYLGRQREEAYLITKYIQTYIKCKYGQNNIQQLTGVQFIKSNNIIVDEKILSNDNVYISKGNIYLEYFAEGLSGIPSYISNALYQQISNIIYMPAQLQLSGKPYLEVGDYVEIDINNDNTYKISFPILQRTLKGIQSLRDTFEAKGEEYRKQNY